MSPSNELWKRTLADPKEDNRTAAKEIGEHLKNLHSETAAEPLPEEMRRLLKKLDRRKRSSRRT